MSSNRCCSVAVMHVPMANASSACLPIHVIHCKCQNLVRKREEEKGVPTLYHSLHQITTHSISLFLSQKMFKVHVDSASVRGREWEVTSLTLYPPPSRHYTAST